MPESTEDSSLSGFGANEWLVDEMYEKYQQDPKSVDKVWWDFFGRSQQRAESATRSAEGSAAASNVSAGTAVKESTGAPKRRPSGNGGSAKAEQPAKSEKSAVSRPTDKPQEKAEQKVADKTAKKTADSAADGKATPKEAERPSETEAAEEPTYTVLRGAPARTVANMDASLTRADRDQRALGAGQAALGQPHRHQQPPRPRPRRQGLLHPPDRLRAGQGAASMPEMNVGFEEKDGKPTLVTPAHINLGLAIDLPKDDGSRQLLVPSIKARRVDGLRAASGRPTRT